MLSLTVATAWLGWVAVNFQWPAQMSRNIGRHTAGYEPSISWVAFGLALLVTIGWVALVVWRLRVKPQALWRGTVLSAGGLTATWILLVLLWQPAVDYARSYRIMSGQLAQALEQNLRPGECVRGLSLGSGQRASFLIFNNLTFTFDSKCTVVLQQTTNQSLRDNTAAYSDGAEVLWQAAAAPTATKCSACCASRPTDDARSPGAPGFGATLRGIARQAWPVLVSQWAGISFGVLDTAMTGHASPTDLAAMALSASIYITIFVGLMGVVHALIPILAQHFGAGNNAEVGRSWGQGVWLALGLSVVGAILMLFPDVWLSMSGDVAPDVRERIASYLRALVLAMPAALVFRTIYALGTAVSRPSW